MSLSAPTTLWNSSSAYHSLRESDAKAQVEQFILPRLLSTYTPRTSLAIADFACGQGAIACEVVRQCNSHHIAVSSILLIDVTQDNLDAARSRLSQMFPTIAIQTFLCNGSNFAGYSGTRVDFLYSWDAMVHFDIIDITGYIKDLTRVCAGEALLHHSNYGHVTRRIQDNPHWRNFMTMDTFAQIATSTGLKVMRQEPIDWGADHKALDGLTIVAVD